jgi:hypothetical protein
MKRSDLKRKTPLKAGPPLARSSSLTTTAPLARSGRLAPTAVSRRTRLARTRLRARAPKAKRWIVARTDEAYRGWIRGLPCRIVSPACGGPTHPHHVKTRGAGGVDRQNLVPLCAWHHDLLHQIGRKTFAKRFGVDLAADAVAFDAIYEQSNRGDMAA